MADRSPIEWTHVPGFRGATWNPVGGCSHASAGCKNCYAERLAPRHPKHPVYAGVTSPSKRGPKFNGRLTAAPLDHPVWTAPDRWRAPRAIFVADMADLFHEDRPRNHIEAVFATAARNPRHIFMLLTKRAAQMREVVSTLPARRREMDCHSALDWCVWPLPNVWLGTSIEDQATADARVPLLLDTPAAIRFVSAEPILGPVDLTRICLLPRRLGSDRAGIHVDALAGRYCESGLAYTGEWNIEGPCPPAERRRLDWVICGGESGPGARPMHPDWARGLRDQCEAAGVPYFFKQWGEWAPVPPREDLPGKPAMVGRGDICMKPDGRFAEINLDLSFPHPFEGCGTPMRRVGKKARAGRLLDGREHNDFPEAVR